MQLFVLSGGSLTVSNAFISSNTFTLSGGTLRTAQVTMTDGAVLIVSSGTLDGVTVNGVLDMGNSINAATLTVTNGLTLNGTALVGNPTNSYYGRDRFCGHTDAGRQRDGGVWEQRQLLYSALRVLNGGTTLMIGPGITVRGQNGVVGYASAYGGPANVACSTKARSRPMLTGEPLLWMRSRSYS